MTGNTSAKVERLDGPPIIGDPAIEMSISRHTPYHARSLEELWIEASAQFPVLLLTGPRA